MYLKKQNRPNGDIYLSIMEKYYVPGKGSCERTYEGIGLVSELKKKYKDPIAHFTAYAKQLTEEKKAERKEKSTETDFNIIHEIQFKQSTLPQQ